MKELNPVDNNKIDLFEIFQILWNGKWTIIASITFAFLIGFFYASSQPVFYKVTTPIQSGKTSVFIDYTSINDVLQENKLLLSDENLDGYEVNASTIFQIFISEFNDYNEMIDVLGNNAIVTSNLKDLDSDQKKQSLLNKAKLFVIKPPVRKGKTYNITFEWNDADEGLKLLEEAMVQTLYSVKKSLISDIDILATSLDMKTQRKLEILNNEIDLIELTHKEKINKHLQFLTEQSAIAKELGLETNNLDAQSLSQSTPGLTISLSSVPFYLRGSNAIDKEIDLIKNRTNQVQLLMADGYIEAKQNILRVENNPASSQLRSANKTVKNDNPNDWIEYNLGLSDVKIKNNKMIYLIFSILIGAALSILYVFISNVVRNRIENK